MDMTLIENGRSLQIYANKRYFCTNKEPCVNRNVPYRRERMLTRTAKNNDRLEDFVIQFDSKCPEARKTKFSKRPTAYSSQMSAATNNNSAICNPMLVGFDGSRWVKLQFDS